MLTDVRVPEILYLANEAEDDFEGEIMSDFYMHFKDLAIEPLADGSYTEPIFVSGEHGDGLPDVY